MNVALSRAALSICGAVTLALPLARATAQERTPAEGAHLAAQQQLVFRHALAQIRPAIVRIDTIGGAPPPPERGAHPPGQAAPRPAVQPPTGPTTGVIWSRDGHILTSSFNFVHEPAVITVTLHDGRQFLARMVARDGPARLALLTIEADELPVPAARSSSELRLGQWALAAGFGLGSEEPALSAGILSARDRRAGLALQFDAKASPANYGGPLFDIDGRLLGIVVPLGLDPDDEFAGVDWYDSGIAFAIGVEVLEERVPRLTQGRDVERGLLGLALNTREPVVPPPDTPASQPAARPGLEILEPPVGPAAAAGLQVGDFVTQVDGRPVDRALLLRRYLATKAAGDVLRVTYRRGEQEATVDIELWSPGRFRPAGG